RIIFRIHDAQEPWIAESLRTSATIKDVAIQEDGDIVAITDLQFLHLVVVGIDVGARIKHLHPWLRLQPLGKISLKRDHRMRGLTIALKDNESRRLRFHILPLDGRTL